MGIWEIICFVAYVRSGDIGWLWIWAAGYAIVAVLSVLAFIGLVLVL